MKLEQELLETKKLNLMNDHLVTQKRDHKFYEGISF